MSSLHLIGIVGGGAFGTALAQAMRLAGKQVLLWARSKKVVEDINLYHHNPSYLPHVKLDVLIKATPASAELSVCDALMIAVPAQHLRATCKQLSGRIPHTIPLILCCKGVEAETGLLMHEVAAAAMPGHSIAVLSGPTFAAEIVRGLPAAVCIAAKDETLARTLAENIGHKNFRPYSSTDVIGVEVGGAIKNVLAIGCGIVVGRGLGESARAALVTRGLAEMTRLAVALGGKAETLMGLSGLGDLFLTCGSTQSRNMALGVALGRGLTLETALKEQRGVVEGVSTAKAALALARKHTIDMPITQAVHAILHEGAAIDDTVAQLLIRPLKAEG